MRHLTPEEISYLEADGCRCDNWADVTVAEQFCPGRYRNAVFSGRVELGEVCSAITGDDGVERPAGIYNAHVHNCRIGRNVLISNIGQHIANCDIAEGAIIADTSLVTCLPGATFGCATEVNVLDETGGLSVDIFPGLTAAAAHLCVTRPEVRTALNALTVSSTEAEDRAHIGARARITGCGELLNINVGDAAEINGAASLSNGTVMSHPDDPAHIGPGVIARDFIMAEGAKLTDATHAVRCYIGQHALLSAFTAHDSLIFANACLCNGEGTAILAGPYTVSDHKSTLLIGGEYLMFNAGSGTNQSNHLYKLGPMHHGSLGRGAKCASDSYILWPAKIGDFTMVTGRHYTHADTTALPFSYLVNDPDGASRIIPAVSLQRVGTLRDILKWPERDKRRAPARHDAITFGHLNPATLAHVSEGVKLLRQLLDSEADANGDYRLAHDLRLSRKAAQRGLRIYTDCLNIKLLPVIEENCQKPHNYGEWADLCGTVMPQNAVDRLAAALTGGEFDSPRKFTRALAEAAKAAEAQADAHLRALAEEYRSQFPHNYDSRKALEASCAAVNGAIIADMRREAEITGDPQRFDNHPLMAMLKHSKGEA